MIEIEKLKGGYILHDNRPASERRIITTTEELFTELLQIFEGRAICTAKYQSAGRNRNANN